MIAFRKMSIVISAFNALHGFINGFLLKTKINFYAFSDECRRVDFPLGGNEVAHGNTSYASFMKKVLHLPG